MIRVLIGLIICLSLMAQAPDTMRRRANAKGKFISSALKDDVSAGRPLENDPNYVTLNDEQTSMIQPETEEQLASILAVQNV